MALLSLGQCREIHASKGIVTHKAILLVAVVIITLLHQTFGESYRTSSQFNNDATLRSRSTVLHLYEPQSASWFHCPSDWIYHSNHCYFFIEAKLSWTQAEAFCSSKGGNLVSITSQTEQNYVTTLLRDIRSPETKEPEDKIWIGLVRHLNQSFIWSNGQTAVEQDGFWAVNGLDSINASPISRLCCYLRAEPPAYQDLRWVLTSNCEEPHASLCIMQPCEEQTVRCEDGSRCINKAWKCDGHWDCKDGSDEAKCNKGSSVTSPSYSRQCGSLLKGASGVLVSPNFPSHYPAFSSCTWKIEVLPPSVIEITVETLAIEAQYDSLQIFDCPDMSDTTLLDYLDGNVSNTKVISSNNCVLVKFQSDHSIEASGFNITWQAVDSHVSGCGGTLYATRSYQHLRFPTSRSRVFKQTSCEWLVSASASTVLHILMNITFQLKGQDTITIYDGPNSKSPLIIQVNSTVGVIAPGESQPGVDSLGMASSNIHPVIVSSGPHLYIHVSLGSKTTGQILSYSEGCDVFISSESSFILSPGYASLHYVNNLKCRWSFQKHGLSKTQDVIFFPNFHTEANKDYVQVRNASCVLETLSGIHLQYQRVSATKSDFFIEFVSDSTVNRGQWAALVSFDCDKFLATPPISVNSTENHFGVVIQFSCPPEYDLVGPASAVCGVNGQWFPSKLPSCKKTDCGPAPAIANGYLVDLNGTEIGSVAQYKCFNGYKIVNHDNAMCEKGVWKSVPVCKAITCPKEPPPANGLALAEYISYGYVREYFCADGYRMIGTKFSHCGSNGQWSHSRPICQAPSCPRLTHIPHGFTNASTDPVFVGTSVKITCDKGYEPSGPNILTCLPSLQYDRPVPFCTDIDECTIGNHTCEEHVCQNLPGDFSCFCRRGFQHPVGSNHTCIDVNECEANNGRCNHQCNNTRGGYLCQCAEHFLLYEGPKDRRSNVSLSPNKTCIETCQPIPLVSGMDVVYGERPLYNGVYILGTNATIKCPSGHHPALSITRCVSLNVWYPNLQKCKVSSCVKPSPPLNGNVYYHNLTVGSSLRYSCREGFVLNQPGSARYCVMNATTGKSIWTGPQPHCQSVDCSQPKAPGNGTVHFTTTYYNSVALFKCYCGFQLIGQSLAKCKADGQWSSQAPFCQIQSCKNPSSLTNASIIKYQQGFPVGSSVTFHCNRTGYTLSDYSSIQCLATKVSKESILQPLATLTHEVYMELGTHLISTCRDACAEKLQELVLIQLQDVVDTATEYGVSPDIIPSTTSTSDNLSVKLTITVSSTKVLNVCNYIDLVNSTMSSMDTEKFRELSSCAVSCPSISVLSASTKTSVTWGCFSGLTFNGQNCGEETGPVCLEECVEKDLNLASDEMINDLEDPQLVFAQSTVRTLSTDQIQSTALSFSHSTEKTLSSDLSFSTPEPITPSTANQVEVVDTSEETTQPTSNHPPSSPSSPTLVHNTSGSQDTTGNLHLVGPQRHTTQPSSIKTSNIEQKTEDPGGHRFTLTSFTDNPTGNYSTLKIDSDREKSPVHLNVTASTNKTSCSNVLSNVKSENGSRGQDSSANETWKDVNDQVNENDCNRNYSSGNQPNNEELLKQAVISSDTTLPIYSVVVTDSMTGAFSNISCINASHVSINTKVNDILREFSSLIGHTVCIKSNSTLELTAGNIKFMGLKASIYINFSLAYTVASEDKTERCAHQFQEFVRKNLPKKFDQVYREVVGAGCEAVNYTGAENEVSLVGWTCHHGYVMDETLFKCLHPRTKASSVPIVVLAVPRLKFAFVANFTADHLRHHMSSDCKKDYTSNVNSLANAYVQELFRNVSGFNVSVDKITTLSYGENVISCNGSVHLVPLQESLNSSSLLSLAMTLANHSQHPAYNLESANSPDVPGCTQIRLTSLRTVVDSSPFYCQPEDVFDDFNLKCLHEELPVLVANVSLSIQGHYTGEQCQRSVTASAEVMYKEVVKDIQISIGRRQICNTAKDTLIQLAQIFVNILDGKVQITLPLKVLSIQGRKQDCEKCVKEVFHYLRTALVQPTDAMVQNITQSCRQNVQIPENYTTSSAQWKCVPRLQYNSVQHRCESSLDDNNGHQSKRRSKRDVPELVDWSSPPPQCIDLEPPKFQDCPGLPRVITLNQFLSRQVVKLPEVTDNSGLVPIISYNSSYFKIGKPVPKSISLSIKAVDSAGLDATCNIELIIEDEIPPELKCPEVVNISERFPSKTYRIKYSDLNITYSDNSGNVTLKYYPSEDSEVSITEDVMVTVVAADRSGNTRTCQFKIVFFPQGCSSDLLPGHYGVGKNCTETGLNNEDLVCFITCPGHTEPVQVLSCHAGKWNSSLQECAVANGCPAGYSYASYGVCYECDVGYYRSNLTLKECVKCPDGQSTPAKKSTSLSECQEMCGLNEFSATGLKPCQPCPHGYHQPKNGSKYCEKCSHTEQYCQSHCLRGNYSTSRTAPCKPCPLNYYNLKYFSFKCNPCPDNQVTKSVGSKSRTECVPDNCPIGSFRHNCTCFLNQSDVWCTCNGSVCSSSHDPCQSHPCHNHGTCHTNGSEFTCHCPLGYTGPTCAQIVPSYQSVSWDHGNNDTQDCKLQCDNGGTCVPIGPVSQCHCLDGFTGLHCEVNMDDCLENYCLNGGQCLDGVNIFTCLCPKGFSGDLCQINLDDCVSSPCQNNGVCIDNIDGFTCVCQPGYSGDLCERVTDPCQSNPCENNGTCMSSVSGSPSNFSCDCAQGYTGQTCETAVSFCDPMPCNINGTSRCQESTSECLCLPNWQGKLCSVYYDTCKDNPCGQDAICVPDSTQLCLCPVNVTSISCYKITDACSSSPCENSGQCILSGINYTCQCSQGFTGLNCETNIDECSSQPCQNNGTCSDGINQFFCSCPLGLAGELCEVDINECLHLPCLNNGTCLQFNGDYSCTCLTGFTGKNCETKVSQCQSQPCQNNGLCQEIEVGFVCSCLPGYIGDLCQTSAAECLNSSICLNGGKCYRQNSVDICKCSPYFVGPDCSKEQTHNFDLYFDGTDHSAVLIPTLNASKLQELTLCLWFNMESESSYLSLETDHMPLVSLRNSNKMASYIMNISVQIQRMDGLWHQFCFVLNSINWFVYLDGLKTLLGETKEWRVNKSLKLTLGQKLGVEDEDRVKGYLSAVNIYSQALTEDNIKNMSISCQQREPGDVFNWVTALAYIEDDAQISMPSQCGKKLCSTLPCGVTASADVVDKMVPVVVSCPKDLVVTSAKSPVSVTWEEPTFTDNISVVRIKQNYRSGQLFAHGYYKVNYLAYDSDNNSAECSFDLFVRNSQCVDPPPPQGGSRLCQDWAKGRYCVPSCMSQFSFVAPAPRLYRCGQEGVWDPPTASPGCARNNMANYTISGSLTFVGSDCSPSQENELELTFTAITNRVCSPDKYFCKRNLLVECRREGLNRRRRQAEAGFYNVTLNITVVPNHAAESSYVIDTMPETILQEIKNETDAKFTLTSVQFQTSPQCQSGQTLQNSSCVDCLSGYYVDTEGVCRRCPKGWYNEKPLQTKCIKCPVGMTTVKEGSSQSSDCTSQCDVGHFFNESTSRCEPCPLAHYQDKTGQWDCQKCPAGATTDYRGAKSLLECLDLCKAGEELGPDGTCQLCPEGTFRGEQSSSPFCIPCVSEWTTAGPGAVSERQCNIAQCPKGQYKNIKEQSCLPCPKGTYQPVPGEKSCLFCVQGQTTESVGADKKELCIKTNVSNSEYACENICKTERPCDNESSFNQCSCQTEICRQTSNGDVNQILLIASMTLSAVATIVLLVVITVCIHRRTLQFKVKKRVRMYREETQLVAFSNPAFDSLSGSEWTRGETHIPIRLATRWHRNYFTSHSSANKSDVESTNF